MGGGDDNDNESLEFKWNKLIIAIPPKPNLKQFTETSHAYSTRQTEHD